VSYKKKTASRTLQQKTSIDHEKKWFTLAKTNDDNQPMLLGEMQKCNLGSACAKGKLWMKLNHFLNE